jgi:hypothetical protein
MNAISAPRTEVGATLSDDSVRLVEWLAATAPLTATAGSFPHVVNRLAAAWPHSDRFVRLIESLLIADRPYRTGFPFEVVKELTALREFYERKYLLPAATRTSAAVARRPADDPLPWPDPAAAIGHRRG